MNKLSNYTVCIIKPDAFVQIRHKLGSIPTGIHGWVLEEPIGLLFGGAFECVLSEHLGLTRPMVDVFYREHVGKSFYEEHAKFMGSGASFALLLKYKGEHAVQRLRELLGATDPTKATPGTLRAQYGTQLPRNGFHGSDSPEAVLREALFFWSGAELLSVGFPLEEATAEVVRG